jgi:hypothetical protein
VFDAQAEPTRWNAAEDIACAGMNCARVGVSLASMPPETEIERGISAVGMIDSGNPLAMP